MLKCEDCNVVGKPYETIEVHIGRTHTYYFECFLCERNIDESEKLEIH